MGHLDVVAVSYVLPDGRPLLDDVTFRVGDGETAALVGPNGAGKSTLLRIVAGELPASSGAAVVSGDLGVMPQFVGRVGRGVQGLGAPGDLGEPDCVSPSASPTVESLLRAVAPPAVRAAAAELDAAELALMELDDETTQLRYARAITDYGDAGGYELEHTWDVCCQAALGAGSGYERMRYREASLLSGGEQKRLVLEALLRGPHGVLLLDEPDNYLDVPGKRWLEDRLRESTTTVLLVSHDRELLARATGRVVTLEPTAAGATAWVHGGGFATWHAAREERNARLGELRRRWDEEHAKLRALVLRYRQLAAANDSLAPQYQAAQTRLRRFLEAGPPPPRPAEQRVAMRLRGARTGKRAVVCEQLALLPGDSTGGDWTAGRDGTGGNGTAGRDGTGGDGTAGRDGRGRARGGQEGALVEPFDLEVWFGDRVALLGPNGSGKTHLLRLLAAGGTDPEPDQRPVGTVPAPVPHSGVARLGARVRPGWFAQTHEAPQLAGRSLLEVLHRGDRHREGLPREPACRALDRYGLVRAAEQSFGELSGGEQARFQVLLLELSGATLLLLDEPTDNLDLDSAEALQDALARFEGTVLAVTHDRWFVARGFDRFLVLGEDGRLREHAEPVWA